MSEVISASDSSFSKISLKKSQQYRNILGKILVKDWGIFKNSIFFYFLTWIILSTYGGKACPFIEGTTFTQVAGTLLASISVFYLLRLLVLSSIGRVKVLCMSTAKYTLLESVFLLMWVISLGASGIFILDLGGESLGKLVVGSSMLSIFVILNLVLIKERFLLLYSLKTKKTIKRYKNFASLRLKFIIMATFTLTAVGIAFALTNYKNFHWLIKEVTVNGDEFDQFAGILSVFKETIFVIGVFLAYIILTAINYTTSLILFFVQMNDTIERLFMGDFSVSIPVLANDEFGILSENIKVVSSELQEKKKLKNMFGKLVSPKIAEILGNEEEIKPGGDNRDIIVLFSDIRNFTSYSENTQPSEVIGMLNGYFSEIVGIIERNDGVVDKFMGDGIMALFGLESLETGINNAVRSSIEMYRIASKRTNPSIEVGVGLAAGSTIVGLVGAQNRLDFTAIGDTVNTAARLESATKEYKQNIIISQNMYAHLDEDLAQLKWEKIDMTLKGKSGVVAGYGLRVETEQVFIT